MPTDLDSTPTGVALAEAAAAPGTTDVAATQVAEATPRTEAAVDTGKAAAAVAPSLPEAEAVDPTPERSL